MCITKLISRENAVLSFNVINSLIERHTRVSSVYTNTSHTCKCTQRESIYYIVGSKFRIHFVQFTRSHKISAEGHANGSLSRTYLFVRHSSRRVTVYIEALLTICADRNQTTSDRRKMNAWRRETVEQTERVKNASFEQTPPTTTRDKSRVREGFRNDWRRNYCIYR